jgi:hypothetical protein
MRRNKQEKWEDPNETDKNFNNGIIKTIEEKLILKNQHLQSQEAKGQVGSETRAIKGIPYSMFNL